MKVKFSKLIPGILFTIIGAYMILEGIISTINLKKITLQTTATVVNVSEDTDSKGNIRYIGDLTYNVDGKKYNTSYFSSSHLAEGSNIIIYYYKNNPAKTTTTLAGNSILSVFGMFFFIPGVFSIGKKINKIKRQKKMIETGDKIYANFKEVMVKNVNNRQAYIIICTGKDNITGEERTFKSKKLWNNPEDILKERNIITFPVYIDITNRKKYYLSLEELEK